MGTEAPTQPVPAEMETNAIARAMNAIRSVVRALRINTRSIELKMGISLAQLFVLQQLAERSSDSLNDLASRTATHQSSVSVVVRRLVQRGLVSRTPSTTDKRRIEIAVTAAGRSLLIGAPTTIQTQLMNAMHRMPSEQQTQLADLLESWLREANIDIASPPMIGEDETD
jgi:DNA-binding MarR family transcriptional regulator